jgi:DNA-binding NtrC family response regulator
MSAYATAEERYAALKQRGGILKKPITDSEELYIQLLDLEDRLSNRRTRFKERLLPPEVIGECEALGGAYMDARLIVDKRAPLWKDQHIFIFGERGTGKTELVRSICRWLGLGGEPLHIDCGEIAETADSQMAHSFFFGHIKGAFTGAVTDQPGQFDRLTNQGLVHIDNLHCLNRAAQQPLVKFLERGSYTPVGGAKRAPKAVKARLVVTTSENPETRMLEDRLSEDVYRRLIHSDWFITLPPLRERGTDVVLLARHFCAQWKVPEDAAPPREMRLSEQAEQALLASLDTYHWRGNVSEVSGVVAHACRKAFLKARRILLPEDFPFQAKKNASTPEAPPASLGIRALKVVSDEARKAEVLRALRQTKGNIAAAARLLGVSRAHLHDDIIPGYEIDVEAIRGEG